VSRSFAWALAVTIVLACACGPKDPDGGSGPAAELEEIVLGPRNGPCTELDCSADPCCNTCQLEAWLPLDAPSAFTKLTLAPGVDPLPTEVQLDDCGKSDFHIVARGTRNDGTIVVHEWQRQPGPAPTK
jgi:hypothetical protein